MKIGQRYWSAAVVALVALALLNVGCESTESADSSITVTPADSELQGEASVALVASLAGGTNTEEQLILPLEWRVADPEYGSISSDGGVTAIYTSNGKVGATAVTVEDQIGRRGAASITQIPEESEVITAPSSSTNDIDTTP